MKSTGSGGIFSKIFGSAQSRASVTYGAYNVKGKETSSSADINPFMLSGNESQGD